MIFSHCYVKLKKIVERKGFSTMKKSHIVILVSVLLSVAAAVTATILVLKHVAKKRAVIAPADLAFENDFSEEDEALAF